ncbi:MAG: hypothetical protein WKF82_02375 [Nocardioidaceae bacterium]
MTVAGQAQPLSTTKAALDRLQSERPFMHSLRYDEDRVELAYWEEAGDVVDAASLALRLWNEHRESAELPPWRVVGLEVVDLDTFQSRQGAPAVAEVEAAPRRF